MNSNTSFYLPTSPEDEARGLYLATAGRARVAAGAPYPPGYHPADYTFDWAHGRVLEGHALVYLTQGAGRFETEDDALNVGEGDLLVLSPGVWHRYAPDPTSGWEEYWIAFNGNWTERLMEASVFVPQRPVLRIGRNERLRLDFEELLHLLEGESGSTPGVAAAAVHGIVARVAWAAHNTAHEGMEPGAGPTLVHRARRRMLEHLDKPLQMESLAAELGVGYSSFRHRFKQLTGLSPKAYLIDLRMEMARTLLTNTDLPVQQIASKLAFESPYYFMRLFKQKTTMTPSCWRNYSRGRAG